MTEAQIIVFPLTRRVGKIRTVAATLSGMKKDKIARAYRMQITAALLNHLGKLGVAPIDQNEPVFEFWRAVHDEIAKSIEGAA
ncbi:hypothetical protein CN100_01060 [Sinorhizobium meliloti]|uniref:DUF6074 family protein n=1 Tax=Rhizobium meliloti TaxID=382 RepID=UPI00037761D5|nr:DUF6074 family protein [Sinorhizobium meliloti]MDX1070506.1 hypothetical protein [Sinorhizobium medicae]ATB03601.1 hypothetical protein BWO90_16400 [Sinorhizobium meliloti]MDE3872986.1 hypothetical protein [Sinorhizobium meliloti]RVH32361.1 hypothetical protein CN215_01805 [Sinorhizobium meliloti]RVN63769.1 hypothetical protein CN104_15025 [Sinorhizobium meliloti]